MRTILEGIVGSHAYGLATPASDVDYRGVFVVPIHEVVGLKQHRETVEFLDPNDTVRHEIAKFLRLALKANPNIIELLWLDEFTTMTAEGRGLVDSRERFVSKRAVKTYGGYAFSQLTKMERQKRVDRKHARHCLRLVRQGREYLERGTLTLKVDDPEEYWALDSMEFDDVTRLLRRELDAFDRVEPRVPDEPDYRWANEYLLWIRGIYSAPPHAFH